MGTNTEPYKFYKPDPSDLVDVETNINVNFDIVDSKFKGVFAYQPTDVLSLTTAENIDRSNNFKYYKTASNSVCFFKGNNSFQDANVGVWITSTLTLTNGWNRIPTSLEGPTIAVDKEGGVNRRARIVGTMRLNNYDALVSGSGYNIALVPVGMRPSTEKHYMVNTNQNNGCAKITVFPTGIIQMVRFGPSQVAGNNNNIVSLDYLEWEI